MYDTGMNAGMYEYVNTCAVQQTVDASLRQTCNNRVVETLLIV